MLYLILTKHDAINRYGSKGINTSTSSQPLH